MRKARREVIMKARNDTNIEESAFPPTTDWRNRTPDGN
jgi:hypothetical protein